MAAAVDYLHSLSPPLLHRDLKSPNVFLTRPLMGGIEESYYLNNSVAKVGDFGLSVFYETELKRNDESGKKK